MFGLGKSEDPRERLKKQNLERRKKEAEAFSASEPLVLRIVAPKDAKFFSHYYELFAREPKTADQFIQHCERHNIITFDEGGNMRDPYQTLSEGIAIKLVEITEHKPIILGRNPETAQIILYYQSVSREHCEFRFEQKRWHVHNKSSNGTTLQRGRDVSKFAGSLPLEEGDILKAGDITLLVSFKPKFR